MLTGSEKDDGLEASELGGVNSDGAVAVEGVTEDPDVGGHLAGFPVRDGGDVVAGIEERACVHRQAPLDRVQEEQLRPALLQQDHLKQRRS